MTYGYTLSQINHLLLCLCLVVSFVTPAANDFITFNQGIRARLKAAREFVRHPPPSHPHPLCPKNTFP